MTPTSAPLARIDAWLDRLAAETDAARHSAAFTAYLRAQATLYRYSVYNQILLLAQRPDGPIVSSRLRWERLGYVLTHGAWMTPLHILCPQFCTVRDAGTGEERQVLTHFSLGAVYARDQVDATPAALPLTAPWQELRGDDTRLFTVLVRVCARLHIQVSVRADLAPGVLGYSTGNGRIVLSRALATSGARVATLVHELAHEIAHPRTLRHTYSRQEVECQADAICSAVLTALGVPTPNSPTYLALYGVERETLRRNVQAIHAGTKTILDHLEKEMTHGQLQQTDADRLSGPRSGATRPA